MLLALLTGCAAQTAIKDAPNPLEIDVTEYDRMFEATIAVLREQGMGVQVKDYRMGTIVSQPALSPSAMEVWRIENSVAGNRMEATLNKQRRIISVNLTPAPGEPADNPQTYHMAVQVVIEQEQNPRHQLTGSTSGYRLISSYSQTPEELAQRGITGRYWYPVGTDPLLENKLLRTIVHRSLTIDMPNVDNSSVDDVIDKTQSPKLDGLEKQ
jgi:hypothetical protein